MNRPPEKNVFKSIIEVNRFYIITVQSVCSLKSKNKVQRTVDLNINP